MAMFMWFSWGTLGHGNRELYLLPPSPPTSPSTSSAFFNILSFIHSFVHLVNKYFWRICYVPDTVLHNENKAVLKRNTHPWSMHSESSGKDHPLGAGVEGQKIQNKRNATWGVCLKALWSLGLCLIHPWLFYNTCHNTWYVIGALWLLN